MYVPTPVECGMSFLMLKFMITIATESHPKKIKRVTLSFICDLAANAIRKSCDLSLSYENKINKRVSERERVEMWSKKIKAFDEIIRTNAIIWEKWKLQVRNNVVH